jgi:hypothetical protein
MYNYLSNIYSSIESVNYHQGKTQQKNIPARVNLFFIQFNLLFIQFNKIASGRYSCNYITS